jgi:biotin carboxylase
MNLLVTNTRNAQAYAIIRALRPHAEKIVATMEGDNRLTARLSHAANSRLVDKRCYTPSPAKDWRAGRIQKENTEREEAYIQAVLSICEQEKINTIFPSFDPHVYVFSKNKERFEKRGVLIPVPDYETVVTPLDKYRTIQAAQEAGFPCPRTYLPESDVDLRRIAEEVGFPLVVKPRFTAGGWGTHIVSDLPELMDRTRLVRESQSTHMIQEYIPGKQQQHFNLVLDKHGALKVTFCREIHRFFLLRLSQNAPTASETTHSPCYATHAGRLVQRLGWWGGVTVQTKIDHRHHVPKLMEINPRLGFTLWNRTELGINEPLMCLKIARGEDVEAVRENTEGIMFLSPVEDALALGFKLLDLFVYKFRVGIQGESPIDPSSPPMTLSEIGHSYKKTYLNVKKKVFDPYFRYFLQDPVVSILWWLQFSALALRALKQLGR